MCCPQEQNLSQMVRDFIESESPTIFRSSSESLQAHHESASLSLQEILENVTDAEIEVLGKVLLYLDDTEPMDQKPDNLRKWVGLNLKIDSYEASLCKTSWVTTFGRPAGEYEYIDVMIHGDVGDEPTRLIVDIDFRSQFELARPTPTYTELSNSLPPIFVGTEEKLNKLICLLCSAAEQSLKERELHIPPWRKASYMQSKWLSQNCKKVSF